MKEWQSLAHTKWECKYHVVIVPKYRKKVLYGRLRKRIGEILRAMLLQRHRNLGSTCNAGSHTYVYIGAPEVQYSDDNRVSEGEKYNQDSQGIIKTEPKGFTNKNFWTRGYCVSTVGLDEKQIREYIPLHKP